MSFESPATTGLSGCSKGSRMLIPIAISCPAPTCAASMIPSPPPQITSQPPLPPPPPGVRAPHDPPPAARDDQPAAPRHLPSEGDRLSIAGGAGTAPRGSEYGHLSKTLKPREHL